MDLDEWHFYTWQASCTDAQRLLEPKFYLPWVHISVAWLQKGERWRSPSFLLRDLNEACL